MRLVFALVTLLHCQLLVQCIDLNITKSILQRLNILQKLNLTNETVTRNNSWTGLQVPDIKMLHNADCCVTEFKRLLKEMFQNVTLPPGFKNFAQEILNDLDMLQGKNCKVKPDCPSKPIPSNTARFKPFTQFIMYLKKLNNKSK